MKGVSCSWCLREVRVRRRNGHPPMTLDLDGQAHAGTCPQRVRIARIVDRPDPIQKLIPATAKMREPIGIKAKR